MTFRSTPSVQRTIGDEHAELRRIVEEIQEALSARSPTCVAQLVRELAATATNHFRCEEQGGYFAEAIEAAPQIRERARELLGEHPLMTAQLLVIERHAARGGADEPWWHTLEEMFRQFLEQFSVHEAAENSLIHEALCDDLGTGD
jgi:hypothetical protein